MGVVVGVDGGGSGCRVVVLTLDGQVAGRGEGRPAWVDPREPGRAAEAVAEAVRGAAGADLPAAVLWVGLAGAGRREAQRSVEEVLEGMGLAGRVRVGTDVEAAHAEVFATGPGVLLMVGTGSILWGRDPEGGEIRIGGWGSLLGDEGSGYWLALEALRRVARASDGRGPPTLLSPLLLAQLGLPDSQSLIPWVARASRGEVAALAPWVLEAAGKGDPVARSLVEGGVAELRRHLEAAGRAWEPWGSSFPVALGGGLAGEGGPLRPWLLPVVQEVGGELHPGPREPALGAAWLALALWKEAKRSR